MWAVCFLFTGAHAPPHRRNALPLLRLPSAFQNPQHVQTPSAHAALQAAHSRRHPHDRLRRLPSPGEAGRGSGGRGGRNLRGGGAGKPGQGRGCAPPARGPSVRPPDLESRDPTWKHGLQQAAAVLLPSGQSGGQLMTLHCPQWTLATCWSSLSWALLSVHISPFVLTEGQCTASPIVDFIPVVQMPFCLYYILPRLFILMLLLSSLADPICDCVAKIYSWESCMWTGIQEKSYIGFFFHFFLSEFCVTIFDQLISLEFDLYPLHLFSDIRFEFNVLLVFQIFLLISIYLHSQFHLLFIGISVHSERCIWILWIILHLCIQQ